MRTNLQLLRKKAGYKSAKAYAEHMGISPGTYTDYEQGRIVMSIEKAWELADDLSCSLDELAGREWPPGSAGSAPPEPGEARVAQAWRAMNGRGRAKLEEYADDLAGNPANTSAKSGGLDTPQTLTA